MKTDRRLVAGVDIGGTNLRCALVDQYGVVTDRLKMPTPWACPPFLSLLSESVQTLAARATARGYPLCGVGIGMPGLITPSGTIFSSVNLSYCEGLDLPQEIRSLTGVPVVAVNDANAAAFGEYRFGAGRPFRTFMMMTIGTGIGGGIILDGRLWAGADGFAAEFGHLTVLPDGRPCPCGNRGCVEQYSSATALMAIARERGIVSSPEETVESLAARCVAGDEPVRTLFSEAGKHLGTAVSAVVNLLNPEAIIVGGGVAASFSLMRDSMRKEIDERSYRPSAQRLEILAGELGDDAGVLGAAAVAFESFCPL